MELVLLIFYGVDVFFNLKPSPELLQQLKKVELSLVQQFLPVDIEFGENQRKINHIGLRGSFRDPEEKRTKLHVQVDVSFPVKPIHRFPPKSCHERAREQEVLNCVTKGGSRNIYH